MSFHFHYHNSYCIVEDIINYPILRCNAARVSYIISSNQWFGVSLTSPGMFLIIL